ncbi:MAG: permease [Candidatus Ancaeobacter aquaticus]|nr:permease [Candidatus Ancaeobacter aquaticus]
MKFDKRTVFAISIVVFIFGIILLYEWTGAWKGYKDTLANTEVVTAQLLEEKDIPIYMLIIVTIVDYVKHSWLCLLLAFLAAGALQEFVPKQKVIQLMGSNRKVLPYMLASFGGPLLSMCSCSIIPLFGGFYKRGAGLGPSLTFLLAAPAFNPAAVLLTLSLLGWKFTVVRIVFAIFSGITVGFLTEKILKNKIPQVEPLTIGDSCCDTDDVSEGFGKRIINMLMYSWDFVKLVLPLILVGVILAGLVKAFLPPAFLVKYLGVGILPIMLASAIGVLMYAPSLVEAPLIRGLLQSGMGTGPAMAHLITGPSLSLPSILGVCKIVSPKVPLVYTVLMWFFGVIAGLVFWYIMPVFNG